MKEGQRTEQLNSVVGLSATAHSSVAKYRHNTFSQGNK